MTKELRGIIEKMVYENPDIEQIATDWSPSNIGAAIWVQIPDLTDKERCLHIMESYSDYINTMYTPEEVYDECRTLVIPQAEQLDDDPNTPLVYDKKRGIIDAV